MKDQIEKLIDAAMAIKMSLGRVIDALPEDHAARVDLINAEAQVEGTIDDLTNATNAFNDTPLVTD